MERNETLRHNATRARNNADKCLALSKVATTQHKTRKANMLADSFAFWCNTASMLEAQIAASDLLDYQLKAVRF